MSEQEEVLEEVTLNDVRLLNGLQTNVDDIKIVLVC